MPPAEAAHGRLRSCAASRASFWHRVSRARWERRFAGPRRRRGTWEVLVRARRRALRSEKSVLRTRGWRRGSARP